MRLIPTDDRIVIAVEQSGEVETVLDSGLVLASTADSVKETHIATILAVGPGRVNDAGDLIPMQFEVGQQVVYAKYGGTDVTIDGTEYLLIRESEVLAVVGGAADAAKVSEVAGEHGLDAQQGVADLAD